MDAVSSRYSNIEQLDAGSGYIRSAPVARTYKHPTKGDFVIRTQQTLLAEFTNYGDRPGLSDASAIAQVAVDAFQKGEVDAVYLVYARFVNTVSQQPTSVQLLPVQPPAKEENEEQKTVEYIYEPDARTIFEALLPRYVDVQVYQALLETVASFYSAQMVAMKNATDSAQDLVQDLTLTYNKARQSAITMQILEVVAESKEEKNTWQQKQ